MIVRNPPQGIGIHDIVEDLTPQLGGNLDTNGNSIDSVTPTELGYLSGVSSAIQTQIDSKQDSIRSITTVNTATYDLLSTDEIISVTYTSTGAVTSLTLPTAQCISGRLITIKDAGGNAYTNHITIDTEGAETIDGIDTLVVVSDYYSVTLYSDGNNWLVI